MPANPRRESPTRVGGILHLMLLPRAIPALLLGLALALSPAGRRTEAIELNVTLPTTGGDGARGAYPAAVLKLGLDHWAKGGADRAFRITVDPVERSQTRVIEDIARHDKITLFWMGTSAELEAKLLPVRIPIWRGLLGYRLFLINGDSQPAFSRVRSLADLRRFSFGQGFGWADTKILESVGLRVDSSDYEHLFGLLAAGRIDAFPRGAGEIFPELEAYRPTFPGLSIESSLVLKYRFDQFFFTARDNPALADAVREGLEAAYADGSFEASFFSHPSIRNILRLANLGGRRSIEIDNPTLSAETAAIPSKYWFEPPG